MNYWKIIKKNQYRYNLITFLVKILISRVMIKLQIEWIDVWYNT
jgi:hypothetical protein